MFANLDSERRLRTVDQTMIDLMFVIPLVNQVGFRSRRFNNRPNIHRLATFSKDVGV